MTAHLEVEGLYKIHTASHAEVPVLRGVSFDVAPGEFVCVMGPSGSGKTTLLHLLSGLDQPSAGAIRLGGQDLTELAERERTLLRRREVGYVFQFFNLMPNLTVEENIGLPISIAGGDPAASRDRIRAQAEALGIAHRLAAYPHELSGGEMQRASIARALVGGQKLLLCDEPTGNLAQRAGAEVMELLRRARDEEGRTVVLVTHNPRDAAFADRVLFLVDGVLATDAELRRAGAPLATEDVHAALARLSI